MITLVLELIYIFISTITSINFPSHLVKLGTDCQQPRVLSSQPGVESLDGKYEKKKEMYDDE